MLLLVAAALAECTGTPSTGWGCRERLDGWEMLDLHGTDAQIGRLYGELMHEELTTLYVPMLEEEHYGALPAIFRGAFLRHQERFPGFFDAAATARAAGLEGALGLSPGTWRKYAWFTELASIGPAAALSTARTVQLDGLTGTTTGRCTSVVGREGEATVHARNLDFWGMGLWQPYASMLWVEPLTADGRPDGHRFVQLGTIGEVFAGSTGLNEHGVVVTTHLHVTRDVALVEGRMRISPLAFVLESLAHPYPHTGESVYVLFERVLRRASNVGEAVAILSSAVPTAAWSFVVSDPSGDSAIVGVDAREVAVTRGARVMTNFYLDPGMRSRELVPVRGPVEGARLRYERARQLLDAAGELSVEDAAGILRDRFDLAVGADRPVSPNTVVSPDTTQSVAIRTRPGGDHEVWAAVPHADGYTPAPFAPFRGYRFRDGFSPGRRSIGEIPWSEQHDPVRSGYLDAMRLLLDEHDPRAALAVLRELGTDDGGIVLTTALLAASQDELDVARALQERADTLPLSAHHRVLSAFLAAELDNVEGVVDYDEVRARIAADTSEHARLNAMIALVIRDRERGGRPAFPVPDLKFQDVLELRAPNVRTQQ